MKNLEDNEKIINYKVKDNNMHTIIIKQHKITEPSLLIYAYGRLNISYWEWKSAEILPNPDPNFRGSIETCDFSTGEIKGYILLNKNGDIIEKSFEPVIRQIGIRLEIKVQKDIKNIQKLKIGEKNLPQVTIPLKFYDFNDISIENRIKNFLEKKSCTNKIIKIMEPYLSIELIDLLHACHQGDLKIQILTKQLTKKTNENSLKKKLESLLPKIKITIKQLVKEGEQVKIRYQTCPNPFHDRFIISEGDVLIIGTSINSIINNSTFVYEINNYKIIEEKFDEWFSGKVLSYKGNRLKFEKYYES